MKELVNTNEQIKKISLLYLTVPYYNERHCETDRDSMNCQVMT